MATGETEECGWMHSARIHSIYFYIGIGRPVPMPRIRGSEPAVLPYGGGMGGKQLWTTGDIAQRLGISVQRARLLSRRPDFPDPVQEVPHFSLWRACDVESWLVNGAADGET
ncbi:MULTISPECIES: helix-turn-helix transcriptional regulator [unclassified Frankia]|uniref:helix-turn-helix transcriptional regulator n=1 Tax=unclassified Frankia TaxID=2632575 RepID=UPI0040444100